MKTFLVVTLIVAAVVVKHSDQTTPPTNNPAAGTVPTVPVPASTGPLCDSNGAPCTDTQLQHVRDNCARFAQLGYTCK